MQETVMAERKQYQWVVRGVDQELARQFVDRAASQRRPTGAVLNEVLRAYLDWPEDSTLPVVGVSPTLEEAGDLRSLLLAIQERLSLQEKSTLTLSGRTDNLSNRVRALETDRSSLLDPRGSPAASPVSGKPAKAEASGKTGKGGRRSPRPWTNADNATLRLIIDRGGTQAEAAREMDRSDGTISERWRKLLERENVT
jgi:hypothetical protein